MNAAASMVARRPRTAAVTRVPSRQLGFARELERITRTGADRGGARCGGDVATPAPDTCRVDRRRDDGGAIGPARWAARGDAYPRAVHRGPSRPSRPSPRRRALRRIGERRAAAADDDDGDGRVCRVSRRVHPPTAAAAGGSLPRRSRGARLDARRGYAASPTSSSDGTHNPVSPPSFRASTSPTRCAPLATPGTSRPS